MNGRLVIFDVWGPFAYFRKISTTTTALTYSLMPRSCIEGLIGAVLGLSREEYPENLKDAKIALGIVNEIRKISFPLMHTHTDYWSIFGTYIGVGKKHRKGVSFRAPARVEYLRNPYFRIYFSQEKFIDEVDKKLSRHRTVFFPYLGTNSMIANFKYLGSYEYVNETISDPVPISSVIPYVDKMPQIFPEIGVKYAIEQNLPIHLTNDRLLKGAYSAVYSPQGKPVKARGLKVQRIIDKEEKVFVTFIPTQVSS